MGSFELDSVDRFFAGAIGEPGNRTFFVQVVSGPTLLSFKCEKQQVGALAERMTELLTDLPPTMPASDVAPTLAQPVLAEWAIGAIGIGYEPDRDRILILFHEVRTDDAADGGQGDPLGDDTSRARLSISRDQAYAFARHAVELVKAGRPTCVRCGTSIDGDGYRCVCFN